MDTDEAVALTQERLAREGGTLGDLLDSFRNWIPPVLIGDAEWSEVLDRAGTFPITLASLPFGFELPLHSNRPEADFGVSVASGTAPAEFFRKCQRADMSDETARAVVRLFRQMELGDSPLRDIVGRKLMLEYDIGSARDAGNSVPGMFLRPGERPIMGACGQADDASLVVDALVSCLGWEMSQAQRANVRRVYLAQPEDTRMDSFGVFPSRSRAIRLAIMGFKSQHDLCLFLKDAGWPCRLAAVNSVVSRFDERVNLARIGANVDVQEQGIGPTLGLTLIVKQRFPKDSRYWLDGLTDWQPFLDALGQEGIVVPEKLAQLAKWVSKPTTLYAKSGRYLLLRGIHHIKLVISDNELRKAKAYVFMVMSGAVPQ